MQSLARTLQLGGCSVHAASGSPAAPSRRGDRRCSRPVSEPGDAGAERASPPSARASRIKTNAPQYFKHFDYFDRIGIGTRSRYATHGTSEVCRLTKSHEREQEERWPRGVIESCAGQFLAERAGAHSGRAVARGVRAARS